jgi:FHA domain-containing protein
MPPTRPPDGRTIVTELLTEMEERIYPLLYRTLVPAEYHVYLHPDDYREIEGIVPLIVADAQQGLTARVEELNRRRLSTLVTGKRPPVDVPASGWDISIHADANGDLEQGQLGIESRLSMPPPPRFEGGTPTKRIGRTVVTGAIRRSLPSEDVTAGPAGSAAANASSAEATATAVRAGSSPTRDTGADRTARLAYTDDEGTHTFVMRKDLISIGRGGSAHWVDVQLVTTPRVSREHCRIRKTVDGRYFLQDVSSWGTSIDGKVVAPFARQTNGRVEETGQEHELSNRARIQLADAVVIEFSVER